VRYYANPTNSALPAIIAGQLGYIDTPLQGNRRPPGVDWCADNGCYSAGYPGDLSWLRWLRSRDDVDRCAFAVAPDVVGDAVATYHRSRIWLHHIRWLGYPVAYAAQDGAMIATLPWDEFDVLFIGGSTDFKLGPVMRGIAEEAKRRGKGLHMGRVNSERRLRYAKFLGCDSCDGTYLTFGPDVNLPRLLRYLQVVNNQTDLFTSDQQLVHENAAPTTDHRQ
jgi:hypothetical protein